MALIDFGGIREQVVTRKEFPMTRARKVLKGETIAVIGYGVQGPAQALNMKDNGFKVIIGQSKKYPKDWDKIVGGLWGVAIYFALPLVAGLDERFGWTGEISVAWHLAGAVALAVGLGLTSWAMIANAYFSTAVRIQSERGHAVCRSGPYRFVRHPGYVGYTLQALGMPFLLRNGSPLGATADGHACKVLEALIDRGEIAVGQPVGWNP